MQLGAGRRAAPECTRGLAGCAGGAHGAALLLMQIPFFPLFAQNKRPAAAASGAFNSALSASPHMPAAHTAPIPFTVPAPLAGLHCCTFGKPGKEIPFLARKLRTGKNSWLRVSLFFLSLRLMLLLLSTSSQAALLCGAFFPCKALNTKVASEQQQRALMKPHYACMEKQTNKTISNASSPFTHAPSLRSLALVALSLFLHFSPFARPPFPAFRLTIGPACC